MSSDVSGLYMVKMELDAAKLFGVGRRRALPLEEDLGYLVHSALGELFGERSPQPFHVRQRAGRTLEVLGYASVDGPALVERARAFAEPDIFGVLRSTTLASKPMPGEWPRGKRLGFEVRTCPVVRMASAGPKHREGAEVDAFLARCFRVADSEPVDREAVYRDWLSKRLADGGAELVTARCTQFERVRLLRRTQGGPRRGAALERPSATFRGILQVVDPAAFAAALARGIGRHRAFGFGMLLLRPPDEERC